MGQKELIESYNLIYIRIINKGLNLLDTDKSRIALPLLEFFIQFLRAN